MREGASGGALKLYVGALAVSFVIELDRLPKADK